MSSAADIGTITADEFEARREGTFQLQLRDGELPLKLHAVQRLGQSQRAGGAFSLIFVASPGRFLPQATYTLVHAEMGTLQLFLVPIGPTEAGNGYEAVFT
ncbi:MAG: hypothetical protein QOF41_2304 [Methylobacteriaceae bacterium]|nr:hypothetical protein [Methylobacteriaceae bacterium]